MILFNILVVIITATIIIYFFWNYRNNKTQPHRRNFDDIRYYELTSKYEFLVAVAALFAIVFGYIGITTKSSLEAELTKNIEAQLKPAKDSILLLKNDITTFQSQIINLNGVLANSQSQLNEISKQQSLIDQKNASSNRNIGILQSKIKEVSESNALKKEFYILKDISISYNTPQEEKNTDPIFKFDFDKLVTVKGEKLPSFNQPPFMIVSPRNGGMVYVTKITNRGFELIMGPVLLLNGEQNKEFKFQVIVYN
jgi:hypothetical protein